MRVALSASGELDAESVVVAVAEAARDAAVEFGRAADGFRVTDRSLVCGDRLSLLSASGRSTRVGGGRGISSLLGAVREQAPYVNIGGPGER